MFWRPRLYFRRLFELQTCSSDLPFSSTLLPSTCQTLQAPAVQANTNAWLLLMDRDSYSANSHTHTLFIEGATRALEQINDFTYQLAHLAVEEMALTGLLLPFFCVCASPYVSMSVSALSDLILECSPLLPDSCLLASGCHMLPSLPVHVKALQRQNRSGSRGGGLQVGCI